MLRHAQYLYIAPHQIYLQWLRYVLNDGVSRNDRSLLRGHRRWPRNDRYRKISRMRRSYSYLRKWPQRAGPSCLTATIVLNPLLRGSRRAASTWTAGKRVPRKPWGYLVVEAGSGNADGAAFVAGLGTRIIRGTENTPPFQYAVAGLSAASVAVSSMAGQAGADGGWAVLLRLGCGERVASEAGRRRRLGTRCGTGSHRRERGVSGVSGRGGAIGRRGRSIACPSRIDARRGRAIGAACNCPVGRR